MEETTASGSPLQGTPGETGLGTLQQQFLERADVSRGRLERVRISVGVRQDDADVDALTAQLLNQVAVEVLDGQDGNWRPRAGPVDAVVGLPCQREAIAVELEGETLGEEFGGGANAAPVANAILKKYFEKTNRPAAPACQPFKRE